jgi:hypothetical protein
MKMTQRIEILNTPAGNNEGNWIPSPGSELERFLGIGNRHIEIQTRLREEAIAVLGGCIEPSTGGANTGLILGRVQSGKTSSFTAVSALAHDNGFKMIIVIAGTSHLLVEQTTERLEKDLALTEQNAFNRWAMCAVSSRDPAKEAAGFAGLKVRVQALAEGPNPLWAGIPIVIVMKNKTPLTKLNNLFKELSDVEGVDFSEFPALIIDDEAHMHSPDVGEEDVPSVIYECIRKLAANFPNRSILQYTATPQANLLMEIANEMSPDFVRILEPGKGYVGGKEIFIAPPNPHVRSLDLNDYPNNPANTDPPPQSLLTALANFLLVCAVDFRISNCANSRSMLIHSDQKTTIHKVYEHWISTVIEGWRGLFADPTFKLPSFFSDELTDLEKTNPKIGLLNLTLEDLRPILVQIMTALRVQTVNHKSDVGKVNFNLAPYWIINGGNILGVGYTIEGLVTTHMIRKPGQGMADTIQQRGRFFGYLNNRFNEVRVFISDTMAKRFMDYSIHEEGLRNSLSKYDSSKPTYDNVAKPKLKEWKRAFYLDPAMIPTRKKAQRLMLERARIEKDGWLSQKFLPNSSGADAENYELFKNFESMINNDQKIGWYKSDTWGGNPLGESNVHLKASVPAARVIEYLTRVKFDAHDSGDMNSACLAIDENLDNLQTDLVEVYLIARGNNTKFNRKRTVEVGGKVELFQGRGGERVGAYVGDRKVFHPSRVSVQIHILDIYNTHDHSVLAQKESVPVIAIHLPKQIHEWAKNILKQP